MSRRAGQIIALIGLTVLIVLAIWYQMQADTRLQTSILNNQYGYGYQNSAGASTTGSTMSGNALTENRPQFSSEMNGIKIHRYIIAYDELTVLDGLQVPLHVPSFTTPVLWRAVNPAAQAVVIDDENAARTAFLAPSSDQVLIFSLSTENTSGDYEVVARYQFTVVSPLALSADVNRDGKYDFQNDLVNLLRNWDSFGNDATRVLALVLSRLEE